MRYLITTVETYRVDTQEDAENLIKEAKGAREYNLKKYSSEEKFLKQKGEIVQAWYRVTLTKEWDNEKEPENDYVSVTATSAYGTITENESAF